ncbi:MAG: phosphoribosyltransferase [Candidatus Dadabacteria bacterium]|nr:MAG: phosphoribosyltransferase [Candidatus Dadabacteria bacterium]
MIPANFKLIYSAQQIKEKVEELGQKISLWAEEIWKDSHSDLLAVPVLRGGIFFFSDLVRKISYSVEIAPVRCWSYRSDVNAEQLSEINVNLEDLPAAGRSILLVDDICDSGQTLETLTSLLKGKGAREVRSAVLIKRECEESRFNPDYVGFYYKGSEWFVGYGMEDCNRWRNLADIYVIQQH